MQLGSSAKRMLQQGECIPISNQHSISHSTASEMLSQQYSVTITTTHIINDGSNHYDITVF